MKIYSEEKWEKVKLGEIFELQMGKTPSRNKENYWRHGENSWISISDMKNEEKYICDTKEKITDLAVEESKIKVIPKDTVIMSFKLSIGKLAITSKDMFTNEAIMAFFPKDKVEIDNNYLFYSLKKVNWTEGTNKAVKGLTLNKPLIASKEILLPNMQIQKEIAKRLDIVMEILKAKRKILLQLDELSKSIFIEMFGDPILNEKNWKEDICKNITLKIGSGSTPKGGEKNYKIEGIAFIRSMNVYNNKFNYKDLVFIDEIQSKILQNVEVKKEDILLNITGASVARCCIVPENILPARVNQHVSIIRCKENIIDSIFLCYQFTTKEYQDFLWKLSTSNGATREALTKQQEENLKVIVPPIELQNQFAERIKIIEKSKIEIQKSTEETQKLFDSLMEKYFG